MALPPDLPPDLPLEISREAMLELPIRRYEGEIVLVETAQALERAAADIFQEAAIGFDTETRPAFRKGESHPPALAQLATARAVYLFPLQRLDFSGTLGELLGEQAILKAGVALADDLRQLQGLFAFQPAGVMDLGHAARRHGQDGDGGPRTWSELSPLRWRPPRRRWRRPWRRPHRSQ